MRHKWEATADPWMGELLPKEDLMRRLDEFSRRSVLGVEAPWAERQRRIFRSTENRLARLQIGTSASRATAGGAWRSLRDLSASHPAPANADAQTAVCARRLGGIATSWQTPLALRARVAWKALP